jgi:hypothetical protein
MNIMSAYIRSEAKHCGKCWRNIPYAKNAKANIEKIRTRKRIYVEVASVEVEKNAATIDCPRLFLILGKFWQNTMYSDR